jgi:hypothetical protein
VDLEIELEFGKHVGRHLVHYWFVRWVHPVPFAEERLWRGAGRQSFAR